MGAGVNVGLKQNPKLKITWVRGAVDSADEKATKCCVRGEVAVDEVNGAFEN